MRGAHSPQKQLMVHLFSRTDLVSCNCTDLVQLFWAVMHLLIAVWHAGVHLKVS